jgi:hypothetical protein
VYNSGLHSCLYFSLSCRCNRLLHVTQLWLEKLLQVEIKYGGGGEIGKSGYTIRPKGKYE